MNRAEINLMWDVIPPRRRWRIVKGTVRLLLAGPVGWKLLWNVQRFNRECRASKGGTR